MKKIFVLALSIALAACSAAAPESDEASANADVMPGTDTAMESFPEINDGMTGPVFIDPDGPANVAVSGYDTVSYFADDAVPVMGDPAHQVEYNGVSYYFSSAENAALFEADPSQYAPQYGGHCAWAMSRGRLAPGDPTQFSVVDGKLYLNFNAAVKAMWVQDIPGFIALADAAWPGIPADARFDNQ